jgi:hypothetical protein
LGWLHDHLPALRDRAGGLYGDLQMNDDAMVLWFFAALAIFVGFWLVMFVYFYFYLWSFL